MSLLMLALLEAAANLPSIAFDLAQVKSPETVDPRCAEARDGDIVVCGKTAGAARFRISGDARVEEVLPRAEVGLFGKVRAAADTEQADVGGFPSNRVMVRVKIPF